METKDAAYNYKQHIKTPAERAQEYKKQHPDSHKTTSDPMFKGLERPKVPYKSDMPYHQWQDHHLKDYKHWHDASAAHHEKALQDAGGKMTPNEREWRKNLVQVHKWHGQKIDKAMKERASRGTKPSEEKPKAPEQKKPEKEDVPEKKVAALRAIVAVLEKLAA